ncbi:MAG TPA: hypothetical protein VI451_19685, partial [Anaerolineales bacterium]|nr:hypothetical protein [Anaerolineales bacterium]
NVFGQHLADGGEGGVKGGWDVSVHRYVEYITECKRTPLNIEVCGYSFHTLPVKLLDSVGLPTDER